MRRDNESMEYKTLVIKSKEIIEERKKEIDQLLTKIPYKLEYRIKSESHIYRKLQKKNLRI